MTKPMNHNFTCVPTIIFVLRADATRGVITLLLARAKPFQVRKWGHGCAPPAYGVREAEGGYKYITAQRISLNGRVSR